MCVSVCPLVTAKLKEEKPVETGVCMNPSVIHHVFVWCSLKRRSGYVCMYVCMCQASECMCVHVRVCVCVRW